MYGLVIESIVAYLKAYYGDEKWMEIRKRARIDQHAFSTHLIYAETTIPRIVESASEILLIPKDELLIQFGKFFVTFVSQYGYDKILRVLGRHMRDFLMGLDNLHEYMRFSYPKLKPPSFFVEKETEHGLILHYRSKRRYGGYVHYVTGQIKCVGSLFYGQNVDIELLKEEFVGNAVHVVMHLRFDNSAFLTEITAERDKTDELSIESELFFEAFPFHIVFTEDMIIKSLGHGLMNVLPNIEGYDISHIFVLKRPMVDFSWEQVVSHTNNVFELESLDRVQMKCMVPENTDKTSDEAPSSQRKFSETSETSDDDRETKLHLKGQMVWTKEWNGMLFLGTPVLPHLTAMFEAGLYINDLSLHDNSRDLVLAGTQTSAELKLALDQEQVKSKKLEESMKKLDEEMRRTDELLYQMIPRQIADRLRAGEPALDTCQVFESVTMLFSDVVGFTLICSRISPLQVVTMLNSMYSKFDNLCSLHDTYKVETIGDAYVVVAGAPEVVPDHAQRIANMAIGMVETMPTLVDPSTDSHLEIRVGINSGVVVAGVVGLKMPRYCLFGDTVNTAAKMESSSERMKIQMTEATHRLLQDDSNYTIVHRGLVDLKEKGKMNTYWLSPSPTYKPRLRTASTAVYARKAPVSNNVQTPATFHPIPSSTLKPAETIAGVPLSFSTRSTPFPTQETRRNNLSVSSTARSVMDPSGQHNILGTTLIFQDPRRTRSQASFASSKLSLDENMEEEGSSRRKRSIADDKSLSAADEETSNLKRTSSQRRDSLNADISKDSTLSSESNYDLASISSSGSMHASSNPHIRLDRSSSSSPQFPSVFPDSPDDITLKSRASIRSNGSGVKTPLFEIKPEERPPAGKSKKPSVGVATRPVRTDLPESPGNGFSDYRNMFPALPAQVSPMYKSGSFKTVPKVPAGIRRLSKVADLAIDSEAVQSPSGVNIAVDLPKLNDRLHHVRYAGKSGTISSPLNNERPES
ncbi:hypothetical protein RvY_09085-2 [Ramazzottius varieornatus]|uniref:guanylate cyclase n=1 Tax=Ramazzottius varieornatus TaxID=947166 RepID=A0A1D1VDP7_RAMVA|nr:hypothetical protein RvY_09085-2 [Ramazzottius varieornatus]